MTAEGHVEAIYIGPVEAGPLGEVPEVEAVAGRGLIGGRHWRDNPPPHEEPGRDITLIEAEAVEALAAEHGIELGPGECLLVPRGIEHRTAVDGEAHIVLFEPAATRNTGNVVDAAFTAPDSATV